MAVGAAGGNGEKVTQTISVIPGQVITVTVGQGGAGGTGGSIDSWDPSYSWNAGKAGGASSFGSVTARGGGGAPANNTAASPSYSSGGGQGGASVGNDVVSQGNNGQDGWVKINYDLHKTYNLYKVIKK